MEIPIYLALQTFADGRLMFRRWTTAPIPQHTIPGGVFEKQTLAAKEWLELAGNPRWQEGGMKPPSVAPYAVAVLQVSPV